MAKIDLRHVYRTIPIHRSNYQATGLKWKFKNRHSFTYFVDTRLPFEGRRAPGIFHRVSQSVKRMMAKRGFTAVVVYLDDFLVVGKVHAECLAAFEYLLQLLQDLGFSISWRKVFKPTTRLIFLGIKLDTVRQCMSLPASKLVELQDLVTQFQKRVRASKRQLQQLAGKLNWACRVTLSALHINLKEALAVCLAAERWAPAWANRQVLVFCDNQAAVGMINKGSTSSPLVMQALCRLFWLSAVFNFRLKMQYVPGSLNVVADAVSRLHSAAHLLY